MRGYVAVYYPMLFEPVLKHYLWGGRNLEKIGRDLPGEGKVAESWEIAAHKDGMTVVANGPYVGQSLQEVMRDLGEGLVGWKNQWALERGKFPLLVKLIDAEKRLSVQVHPDDAYARKHEGNELGKTEMWIVLDAQPNAGIIYGLAKETTPQTFKEVIEKGDLEAYLNKVPIRAGDHICVPSGTLHAILEGALLVEVQQNSNTTYRVYDWNRVGDDGKPRPLHVDKAVDVINFDQVRLKLPGPKPLEQTASWRSERLCQNEYFTTNRYVMNAGATLSGKCDGSTLEIWGLISGKAEIAGLHLEGVKFLLLPAGLGAFEVRAFEEATLLRTFVA